MQSTGMVCEDYWRARRDFNFHQTSSSAPVGAMDRYLLGSQKSSQPLEPGAGGDPQGGEPDPIEVEEEENDAGLEAALNTSPPRQLGRRAVDDNGVPMLTDATHVFARSAIGPDEECAAFAKWPTAVKPMFPVSWCFVDRNQVPGDGTRTTDLMVKFTPDDVWQRVTAVACDVIDFAPSMYFNSAYDKANEYSGDLHKAYIYFAVKCLRASDMQALSAALADFKQDDKRGSKQWQRSAFQCIYLAVDCLQCPPEMGEKVANNTFNCKTSLDDPDFYTIEAMLMRQLFKADHAVRYLNRVTGDESELVDNYLKQTSGFQVQYCKPYSSPDEFYANIQTIANERFVHVVPGFETVCLRVLDDVPEVLNPGLTTDESRFWGIKLNKTGSTVNLSGRADCVDEDVVEAVRAFIVDLHADFVKPLPSIDEDAPIIMTLGMDLRHYFSQHHEVGGVKPGVVKLCFNSPCPELKKIDDRASLPQRAGGGSVGSSAAATVAASAAATVAASAARPKRGANPKIKIRQ
jgi:hypothetical protein